MLRHDKTMFKHITIFGGHGMTRHVNAYISSNVPDATAPTIRTRPRPSFKVFSGLTASAHNGIIPDINGH